MGTHFLEAPRLVRVFAPSAAEGQRVLREPAGGTRAARNTARNTGTNTALAESLPLQTLKCEGI